MKSPEPEDYSEFYRQVASKLRPVLSINELMFFLTRTPGMRHTVDYDMERSSKLGILYLGNYVFQVFQSRSAKESELVVVNLHTHDLRVWGGFGGCMMEEFMYDGNKVNSIIDLDIPGKRWEGGTLGGEPYGYGSLLGSDGKKIYEGFIVGDRPVCYGTWFYTDVQRVMYVGYHFNGYRCGYGVLFDRNGKKEVDGMWNMNHFMRKDEIELPCFSSRMEHLTLNDEYGGELSLRELRLDWMMNLRRVVIGDSCFPKVRRFELHGLLNLESIRIGEWSFTYLDKMGMSHMRKDSAFRIVNCPRLTKIEIGDQSFGDYRLFDLVETPLLQTLIVGWNCFYYTTSFVLRSRIDERRLKW